MDGMLYRYHNILQELMHQYERYSGWILHFQREMSKDLDCNHRKVSAG